MRFRFIPRNYLHFDSPINREFATQLVSDPEAVARHPFFPFIEHIVTTQKIHKRPGGGVERKKPKERPIAYAAHKDSHIFAHYAAILQSLYEAALRELGLRHVVTAFRSLNGQCNIHFADEVFEFIREYGACAVLASDISDFFNQINHGTLRAAWRKLLAVELLPDDHYAVFKAITKYGIVNRERLYAALQLDPLNPRADRRRRLCTAKEFRNLVRGTGIVTHNAKGKGIPQGSPISAILANLYMLEFDSKVHAVVSGHKGLYRRYCDDLLVVLPTAEHREEILKMIRDELQQLGLEAHPDKTELIDFTARGELLTSAKPLNYLGFTFDGRHKRVRPASIARYYKKMRLGVGRTKAMRYRANKDAGDHGWTPLRRRKLHLLYSYLGRHNFTSYVFKAARIMNDAGMKKQIKAHWRKLQEMIRE